MENIDIYKKLLSHIIDGEKVLYGKLTLDIFRKIKGIEIADDCTVLSISGSFGDVIHGIAIEYIRLDGDLSLIIMRNFIDAYRSTYPELDFPSP